MTSESSEHEVQGELIKMIHDELPAVRWSCVGCGEDSCSIFYEADAMELATECQYCGARVLVRRNAQ